MKRLTQKQINKLGEKYQIKRKDYIIKVVHRCMNYVIKQIKLSAQNGEDSYAFADSDFYKCYNKDKTKYFDINTSQFTYIVADNLVNLGFSIKEIGFGLIKVDLTKGIN